MLHCGWTQNGLSGPESAVLTIIFHPSSVLVIVRAKKTFFRKITARKPFMVAKPQFEGVLPEPGYALLEFLVKIKLRLIIIITPMVHCGSRH